LPPPEGEQRGRPQKVKLFFNSERPQMTEGPSTLVIEVHRVGEGKGKVPSIQLDDAQALGDHHRRDEKITGRQ
jgi:hypothetical protein